MSRNFTFLFENETLGKIKRRFSEEFFKPSIEFALQFHLPFEEKRDEWVDTIIRIAADFFMNNEIGYSEDDYDKVFESVRIKLKDLFEKELIDMYDQKRINFEKNNSEMSLNESLSDYDEFDLQYAFFTIFKNWIEEKYGDKFDNFPMRSLLNKYSKEFLIDTGIMDDDPENDYHIDRWDITNIVRDLIEKGKYKLPTLRRQENFTQKFKKGIDSLVKNLKLPPYVSLTITEPEPYELNFEFELDFPKFMLSSPQDRFSKRAVTTNLERGFENFLGVKMGNPIYGELKIYSHVKISGVDEFKNGFLETMKKTLKQDPEVKGNVHSIKFDADEQQPQIDIRFKSWTSYSTKSKIRALFQEYLDKHGVSKLRVQI